MLLWPSQQQIDKARIENQVASPESPRFLQQPVQPLQPRLFYPLRRVFCSACQDIAGGANPDHDCRRELGRILGHEPLLFWSAKTDPEKVRAELFDPIHQVAIFLLSEGSEWWCVGVGDPQSRKF